MELETYFAEYEESKKIFDRLRRSIDRLPSTRMSVSKSQVGFRRQRGFAWAWIPAKVLRGEHAPLVLTVALRYRDPSPRWKEVVEPAPGRFTHHLELFSVRDLAAEVHAWLQEAWAEAA